ncbi:MAG: PmoA family protein [Planctomycetaceae bacterium]
MRYAGILCFSILCILLTIGTADLRGADDNFVWTAKADVPARTPIFLNRTLDPESDCQLIEVETGLGLPLQQHGDQWVALLPRDIAAGETIDFNVLPRVESETASPVFECLEQDGLLIVKNRGKDVFHYHVDVMEPPAGQNPIYRRSGYIHPLYTPNGSEVTGDFAEDHPHQHGLMYAWTNTTYQGRKVDFWNQAAGLGRIEHREILRTTVGPIFAEIAVKIAHVDLTSGTPIDVLHEIWTLRVYDIGADAENGVTPDYIIDFESVQTAVTEEPLQIKEYHYGGFAIRGNETWLGKIDDLMYTSENQERITGNHSRPNWVRMGGKLGPQQSASVLLISHERNFRAPVPVRLHPAKPYFCWAPLVLGDFEISQQKPLRSRIRIAISDHLQGIEKANAFYQSFSHPILLGGESK